MHYSGLCGTLCLFCFLLKELIRKRKSAREEDRELETNNLWKTRIHEQIRLDHQNNKTLKKPNTHT